MRGYPEETERKLRGYLVKLADQDVSFPSSRLMYCDAHHMFANAGLSRSERLAGVGFRYQTGLGGRKSRCIRRVRYWVSGLGNELYSQKY
jgi:hypothetical protein